MSDSLLEAVRVVDARVSRLADFVEREIPPLVRRVDTLEAARAIDAQVEARLRDLRGDEDTAIRRLPARVEALERTPPPVPIWRDEHGRWIIKLALAAAVACAMALSGGLVASDLPGLARAVSAGPTLVPQPVMPTPAMGPAER